MKHKILIAIFSFVLMLSFGSVERVLACSCRPKSPVCEAYGDAKAIFIGEVIEGESPERMSDLLKMGDGQRPFVFKIKEGFLNGKSDNEITIYTGAGFGDCGFPFQKDETYLVYAYEYDGKLQTSICTRTRLAARVESDFNELEALLSKSGAEISGTITQYAKHSVEKDSIQPAANVKLQIEQLDGEKKKFEVITDKQGKYQIIGLPTAKYKISPFLPNGLMVEKYQTNDFLLNDKGCAVKDFAIKNDSRIEGKVIDSNGNPVKSLWVEILPLNTNIKPELTPNEFGLTDSDGTFRLYNIPSGKYILGFNYISEPDVEHPYPTTFYKNAYEKSKATPIEIGLGQNIKNIIVQLPPQIKQQEVRGTIVWADGKPAPEVFVGLKDIGKDYSVSNTETDSSGRFVLKGFVGRKYLINAGKYEEIDNKEFESSGQSVSFILNKTIKEFRIVLERKRVK